MISADMEEAALRSSILQPPPRDDCPSQLHRIVELTRENGQLRSEVLYYEDNQRAIDVFVEHVVHVKELLIEAHRYVLWALTDLSASLALNRQQWLDTWDVDIV